VKHLYLSLSVLGLIGTIYFGTAVKAVEISAWGLISSFYKTVLFDTLFACLVSIVFIYQEATRLKMKNKWLYLLMCFTLPIAAVLPFFLYKRELLQIES
jgi:hypothetical protein